MPDASTAVLADLVKWIGSVIPDVDVSPRPLQSPPLAEGIDVRLVKVTPSARTPRDAPAQVIDLDFLVTVRAPNLEAEQAWAAELLLAAADRDDAELPAEPDAAQLCAALALPPALGFVIRVPLTRARIAERAPLVCRPIVVHDAALTAIEGIIVGPHDVPIAGAVVTEKSLGHSARTDAKGRFRITGAALDTRPVKLNVRGRGVSTDAPAVPGQKIVIRLPLEA